MWRKEFVAHRAQARGKASKDAGHLPVQAVEFAQQICAEEKIAHDWLLETGPLTKNEPDHALQFARPWKSSADKQIETRSAYRDCLSDA